ATDVILWALVMLAMAVVVVRQRRTIAWAGALPVLWLAVMSLFVARLVSLFGEVAVLASALRAAHPSTSSGRAVDPSGQGEPINEAPRPAGFLLVDAAVGLAVVLLN